MKRVYLRASYEQTLADCSSFVFVHDPTDSEIIPVGKQSRNPSHIFYRSCSGIWQTVWLEKTPSNHIQQLDVQADMDGVGM
jgi:hypothetical protein